MGTFNSVWTKEGQDLQYKVGELFCANYQIGDSIDVRDGIYMCHEGAFAVVEGRVVAAFDEERILDKWGSKFHYILDR